MTIEDAARRQAALLALRRRWARMRGAPVDAFNDPAWRDAEAAYLTPFESSYLCGDCELPYTECMCEDTQALVAAERERVRAELYRDRVWDTSLGLLTIAAILIALWGAGLSLGWW